MKLIVPLLLAGALLGAVASVPAAAEHNKHDNNNNKQGKHEGRNNHQDRNQHEGRNRHDGGNQHEGRNRHDGGKDQNAGRNHNQNANVNRHNRNDRFTTKTTIVVSGDRFGSRPRNWNRYPDFYAGNWHRNRHADRRFHWNVYVRPHGWYSHRWAYGERLPVSFWAANYWLNDYWMFDLQIPPRGHVWVRTGDDAILINRRTGDIVEVVYDVFY